MIHGEKYQTAEGKTMKNHTQTIFYTAQIQIDARGVLLYSVTKR